MTTAAVQSVQSKLEEYIDKIHYSDRYSDDIYEYRHVILPKPLLKMIPKNYFNPDDSGTLRILKEAEWRGIGITQSLGWEHYEVHGEWLSVASVGPFAIASILSLTPTAPEPHVLLFRRRKDYIPPQHAQTRRK
ncbi:hypothetical protein ONZ45_g16912 [Pleurotus djamor]|nr:hypothetical protein ONZ45_g16912 [Pleurotus djamor]